MTATCRWLALFTLCLPIRGQGAVQAPSYTQASIVNAATNRSGPLAPNTLATVYGLSLAYNTRAIGVEDTRDGLLPTSFRNSGTRVVINGQPAPLLYASPSQINFVVPANLEPGIVRLQVFLDSLVGPEVELPIVSASPALFALDPVTVIAAHADGALITSSHSARPDETIVLYATGLGGTTPKIGTYEIPRRATPITRLSDLRILFNGAPVDPQSVAYAGLTPGFAGLYQINLRMPRPVPVNPEVRVAVGDAMSPAGMRLPTSE